MKPPNRKVLGLLTAAVAGYSLAFASGAGALFATFLAVGIVGEFGLWVSLVRYLRGSRA